MLTRELRERTPLIQVEWIQMLNRISESQNAPHWNTKCGDRLTEKDLSFVKSFEKKLQKREFFKEVPERILKWIQEIRKDSFWFENKLEGLNIETDFVQIPFMNRSDLQLNIEQIVPQSISLDRLIVNPTSGTTGQPILCPNHPSAIGCYDPMIQFMLNKHGIYENFDHKTMAAIQLCAQQNTITYYTVHSFLNGAGFAKINIMAESEWPRQSSPSDFINELEPVFLSGDPFAFYYAKKMGLNYHPRALLSTATVLDSKLRKELEDHFACPVIDSYSLNETGPLAYSCPVYPDSFHVLPNDIYIEIIDDSGNPVDEGGVGEITVTGGRNPYIPLLRYKTGDFGTIDTTPCECGDPHPKISLLEARKIVLFYNQNGRLVNPIDITRILRNYPIIAHKLIQRKDTSCDLNLAFSYPPNDHILANIRREIENLFLGKIKLNIHPNMDVNKRVIPYWSEIETTEERHN